jgi:O-antigen ligase
LNTNTAELRVPAPPLRVPAAAVIRTRPVTVASEQNWDLLLVCVAGYILTTVGRVHQLFPALSAVRPAILTGLLAVTLYALRQHAMRRFELLWVPSTKWVLAMLAWMMVSAPVSIWPGNSISLVFDNFLKTVLMYIVIAGAVRTVRDVERLSAVYLASATAYAAVVLWRFDIGSGDAWRLGHLYYYDANDFATFAVSALPVALYFAHSAGRWTSRVLAACALLILTIVLVYTGSRGGFLALVAVGVFVLWRYSAIAARWRVTAFVLVAMLLVGAASETYWTQMGTILSESDYNQSGEEGRLQIWRRGVGYMAQFPVLGLGPGSFETAEGTLSELASRQQWGIGVKWNAAHNSFIQVGAELGFAGLVFFLLLLVSAFAALRAARRQRSAEPRSHAELSQALTAALVGFVVGAFFLSLAYHEMLYTLTALAVGLLKVTREPVTHA